MHSTSSPSHVHTLEELLDGVHRTQDLLVSVAALLVGTPSEQAVYAARGTSLEAKAITATLIDRLETLVAVQHEALRNENNQASKHVSQPEVR